MDEIQGGRNRQNGSGDAVSHQYVERPGGRYRAGPRAGGREARRYEARRRQTLHMCVAYPYPFGQLPDFFPSGIVTIDSDISLNMTKGANHMFEHRMHGRGPWAGPRRFGHGRHFGHGRRSGPFNPADPELRSLIGDVRGLGQYLFRQGASGALNDPEKARQLREIVSRTRTEIETLFGPENSTIV